MAPRTEKMKRLEKFEFMTGFISLLVFLVLGYWFAGVFSMPDDGPLEEIAEEFISDFTGVRVDLSPESPDPSKEGCSE